MIAIIFEVEPAEGRLDDYLDHAATLRDELQRMPGFVSVERFRSLTNSAKLLWCYINSYPSTWIGYINYLRLYSSNTIIYSHTTAIIYVLTDVCYDSAQAIVKETGRVVVLTAI